MKILLCYDCGKQLMPRKQASKLLNYPANGETDEHIPAQMMFTGYTYKDRRVTVPCCLECNQKISRWEEEFRNYIGIAGKDVNLSALAEKTARAMEAQNAWDHGKLYYDENDNIISRFRNDMLMAVVRKHFKGIFFHEFGQPLPKEYKYQLDSPNLIGGTSEKKGQRIVITDWLLKFPWKHSGHPDVFKYIIQPINRGMPRDGTSIPFTGKEDAVYCIMICNNTFHTIAGAVRMPD
jgi:hypothetical protein